MIKTSTLTSSLPLTTATPTKEENKLPEFAEPTEATVNNILNFSKSLMIFKSEFVKHIEVVNT